MYNVVITGHFKRQLKPLVKKDGGLKERLIATIKAFDPKHSIRIGKGVFKIRLASQNKGKSSGYRAYLFLVETDGILAPLSIYAKSDRENLSLAELANHLEKVQSELNELT